MMEKINTILSKKSMPNIRRIGKVRLNGKTHYFHPDKKKLEVFCQENGLDPSKIFKRTHNFHIKVS